MGTSFARRQMDEPTGPARRDFCPTESLDGTLGHSFRYVRSSARLISPAHSDRFVSPPSNSLRFSPTRARPGYHETGFKAISGASVSANNSTTKTVLQLQDIDNGANVRGNIVNGFESTSSFRALPLQPAARGETHFLSGPIDRNALSESGRDVPFSAPLGGFYTKKKRKMAFSRLRKAFHKAISEKKQPGVVLELNSVGRKEAPSNDYKPEMVMSHNVQWALGKAGEDRLHVVVSEEHGWLFVGIYDGFNGPDAPEFLICHLYHAVYNELKGLFWEVEETEKTNPSTSECLEETNPQTVQAEGNESRRRRLREFLEEDDRDHGLNFSGSERFSFSIRKAGSAVSKRWLSSKLKHGISKHKQKVDAGEAKSSGGGRKRKVGPVDHDLVLRAMSRALEATELAYLDMTDKLIDSNPELALMGSCVLVVIMRDEDVQNQVENEDSGQEMRLVALQLSTDHSTSIEEEVIRIKNEHPDDSHCVVNDRVKGRLLVTRAFGAGFLKQPKWNDAVLEVFRTDYIGTAPYICCSPSLCHHRLSQRDQFLILSSDGLCQYLTNQEAVSQVENFPDGDPAQHLIEQLLLRAANKAGMEVHELLDIPQGDRRKYHDDVTVMPVRATREVAQRGRRKTHRSLKALARCKSSTSSLISLCNIQVAGEVDFPSSWLEGSASSDANNVLSPSQNAGGWMGPATGSP
ncbi:hypothetical protein K1719_030967 [Acacia pycnantha]|nr:hypothetical protein K1719_030967 [Acacia pycnantha]